jgi:hypothetical protein
MPDDTPPPTPLDQHEAVERLASAAGPLNRGRSRAVIRLLLGVGTSYTCTMLVVLAVTLVAR